MVGHIVYSPEYKRFICRKCASIISKNPEIIKRIGDNKIRELLREKRR